MLCARSGGLMSEDSRRPPGKITNRFLWLASIAAATWIIVRLYVIQPEWVDPIVSPDFSMCLGHLLGPGWLVPDSDEVVGDEIARVRQVADAASGADPGWFVIGRREPSEAGRDAYTGPVATLLVEGSPIPVYSAALASAEETRRAYDARSGFTVFQLDFEDAGPEPMADLLAALLLVDACAAFLPKDTNNAPKS